jgi:hypothetical protein
MASTAADIIAALQAASPTELATILAVVSPPPLVSAAQKPTVDALARAHVAGVQAVGILLGTNNDKLAQGNPANTFSSKADLIAAYTNGVNSA